MVCNLLLQQETNSKQFAICSKENLASSTWLDNKLPPTMVPQPRFQHHNTLAIEAVIGVAPTNIWYDDTIKS